MSCSVVAASAADALPQTLSQKADLVVCARAVILDQEMLREVQVLSGKGLIGSGYACVLVCWRGCVGARSVLAAV